MAKVAAVDWPPLPPREVGGARTATEAEPLEDTSEDGMAAARDVAFPEAASVTGMVLPCAYQATEDPLTKLAPVRVSVKPEPPAVAEPGLIALSVGAGPYP